MCCFILKGVPVTLKELVFFEVERDLSFIIKLVECRGEYAENPTAEPRSPHSRLSHEAERVPLFTSPPSLLPLRPHTFKVCGAEVTTNQRLVQHSGCLGEIPGELGPPP